MEERIDFDDVGRYLDIIDLFKDRPCNEEEMKALLNACLSLIGIVPFHICKTTSKGIMRSRRNEGDEIFSKTQHLSYNNNVSQVSGGRFNLSGQPMFYGSLPTFNKDGKYINYGSQVALFEVCKELKTHQSLTFPSFFTVGCWDTSEELIILNLCHDREHLNQNCRLQESIEEFDSNLELTYSKAEIDFFKEVWQYFSVMSRTWNELDNWHYNILTSLLLAIQLHYYRTNKIEIDGVIYPSAMTDAKGLNIALEPHVVDKKLRLVSAQMYVLKHRGLPYGYQSMTDAITVENGQFQFTGKSVAEYRTFRIMNKLIDNNEQPTLELKRELNELYRISESLMRFKY